MLSDDTIHRLGSPDLQTARPMSNRIGDLRRLVPDLANADADDDGTVVRRIIDTPLKLRSRSEKAAHSAPSSTQRPSFEYM